VIARDDHYEGTFTSRGTVVVMGSVKGRIEAVRVRIEDGARVDADVIVDEAIVAGEFTGNLTCRERLEARASGRINGRVETYRLMLHEGASVEGEMHMLTEAPRDAATTIRGSAPLRGETGTETRTETTAPARPATQVSGHAASPAAVPPATKPAPSVTPSSAAKSSASASGSGASGSGTQGSPATGGSASGTATGSGAATASATTSTVGASVTSSMVAPGVEAATTPRRSPVAEALRLETLLVAPRAMTGQQRPSSAMSQPRAVSTATRTRNGTTTGF
jgi:cytoskeletal protein CcmA (bactofilin family)